MSRSTKDLIDETHDRKLRDALRVAALVVGFEKTTEYVFASDSPTDDLTKLNSLIERGGEPVGILGVHVDGREGRVLIAPLSEYEHEEWVMGYLGQLAQAFAAFVALGEEAKGNA